MNLDKKKTIVETAREIFITSNYIKIQNGEVHVEISPERPLAILSYITDNGMIYLSTDIDVKEIINEIDGLDDTIPGLMNWLLQSSVNFRVLAFDNAAEYTEWVTTLVEAYSQFGYPHGINLLDEELRERLVIDIHDDNTYHEMLKANPWFVFLLTLQFASSKIGEDLINMHKGQIVQKLLVNPNE